MKGSIFTALATAAVLASAPALATSADVTMLAETCAGCHGTDGASAGPASPSLAGMDRNYFIQSMKDFVSGERPATVMDRIAKGYTEEDFAAMAAYFADRQHTPAQQPFDAALATRGQALQAEHCENCHKQGGAINDDGVTILAGQWKPYLAFAVADFQDGSREMERRKKRAFDDMMAAAGADGFDAVLHYLASKQ